jgi:hypothetical protein
MAEPMPSPGADAEAPSLAERIYPASPETPAPDQAAENGVGSDAPAVEAAVPAYTEFKMPDDFKAGEKSMQPVIEAFQELRLNQEQAQKLVDIALGREKAALQRNLQASFAADDARRAEVLADAEIGGARWPASKAAVNRVFDRLAVPGLAEAFESTRAGNSLPILKAFVRMATRLDGSASGRPPAPAAHRSPSDVIYAGGPKQS